MKAKPEITEAEYQGGRNASALPRLSARLEMVTRLVPSGAAVADIGTDHGLAAVWLYQSGCRRVVAADINRGPLESARRTAMQYGLENELGFALSNGFDALDKSELDAAVIAGMGGETIAEILSQLTEDERMRIVPVVQPQSKLDELCAFAEKLGYSLDDADICRDAGRIYMAMRLRYTGAGAVCDPISVLAARGGELINSWLRRRLEILGRELDGARLSGRNEHAEKLARQITVLESLLQNS